MLLIVSGVHYTFVHHLNFLLSTIIALMLHRTEGNSILTFQYIKLLHDAEKACYLANLSWALDNHEDGRHSINWLRSLMNFLKLFRTNP